MEFQFLLHISYTLLRKQIVPSMTKWSLIYQKSSFHFIRHTLCACGSPAHWVEARWLFSTNSEALWLVRLQHLVLTSWKEWQGRQCICKLAAGLVVHTWIPYSFGESSHWSREGRGANVWQKENEQEPQDLPHSTFRNSSPEERARKTISSQGKPGSGYVNQWQLAWDALRDTVSQKERRYSWQGWGRSSELWGAYSSQFVYDIVTLLIPFCPTSMLLYTSCRVLTGAASIRLLCRVPGKITFCPLKNQFFYFSDYSIVTSFPPFPMSL